MVWFFRQDLYQCVASVSVYHITKTVSGWRLDDNLPMTIRILYRWVETAVKMKFLRTPAPFALFPVNIEPAGVLSYNVSRNGPALVRESPERVSPGDYGIYETGAKTLKSETLANSKWLQMDLCLKVIISSRVINRSCPSRWW